MEVIVPSIHTLKTSSKSALRMDIKSSSLQMFPVNLQPMPPGEIFLQKEDCTKEVEIVAD